MEEHRTQFYTFGENEEDRLLLQDGTRFGPITLAYETYGSLNEDKGNAILLFHALSGSQHAFGYNPEVPGAGKLWTEECRVGWWNDFIGSGKALDTDQFYVICVNYLGGCYGTTGPGSINPETGCPYGSLFPRIRAADIVDSQLRLLDHLGIGKLHAVTGASLGGMLALNLAVRFPDRVSTVIPIACGVDVTLLQRIHNFEQICAIEEDPNFSDGDYYGGLPPDQGLTLARMISHKTFVSLSAMESRARRDIMPNRKAAKRYVVNHQVESYMLHQGQKFVRRFDANTYLRIMEVWQRYDLVTDSGAPSRDMIFVPCRKQRFLVFSIDSDVCYYPDEQLELEQLLQKGGVSCQHITVHSDKGHDAFLLEPDLFAPYMDYILQGK